MTNDIQTEHPAPHPDPSPTVQKIDRYSFTVSGILDVPHGTPLSETGTTLVLPDGTQIGMYAVIEHEDAEGFSKDLSFGKAAANNLNFDVTSRTLDLESSFERPGPVPQQES